MDFENDTVHINNAYKQWEVYDDNMVKIGNRRGDGDLKTSESYRDIPMHPRLKRLLLMIKTQRIAEYQQKGKKLDEDEYIFLNEDERPYVSENLTNKMPKFIKKYKLEHLTTYGLRHSFATLCSTLGMPPEVLHVIMGHADFDTTRKYYIHITGERKKNELLHVWMLKPSFLILDEVDSGLDVDALKIVANSLKEYQETTNCSILLITQNTKLLDVLKPDYVHILKNKTNILPALLRKIFCILQSCSHKSAIKTVLCRHPNRSSSFECLYFIFRLILL